MAVKHPAKYTNSILDIIEPYLRLQHNVLDPFAGTGKLKEIVDPDKLYLNELEPEWALQGLPAHVTVGNALQLPYFDSSFDCICTSPTYSNRMADSHEAKDTSRRNTYTHTLGRKLHPENSGQMQWGEKYREFHIKAWLECKRVLRDGGLFILNVRNHIRNGKEIFVSEWHLETLLAMNFNLSQHYKVETPRQKFGANANLRVDHENVYIMNLWKN